MRRTLGLLSMLFMVHLTLAGSDPVCAKHGSASAMAMDTDASGSSDADHHSHSAQSHGEQQDQCEIPVTEDCCNAVTSCSPTIVIESMSAAAEPRPAVDGRPTSHHVTLLSRVTAPETPPPRA